MYREKVFPTLAEALWLAFLFLDLSGMADSTPVKFIAICLCGLTAWTGAKTADGRLVAAALTLTVCADVFLLLLNRNGTDQVIGVSIFIVVQLLYAYRLCRLRGKSLYRFWPRLALSALWVGLSLFPFWCAGCYFMNLCLNTLEAWRLKRKAPKDAHVSRFAWGLLLFIGCDVCVGAWNLGLFGDFARVGMWFFYLPSQVLIVLSQHSEGDHNERV